MKNFKYFILFLSLITIFEMTNSKDAKAAACTVTNGVYSETEIKNGCEATPDFYEIVIYKMYLCTSAPTIPTTSATVDLTNCSQVFNSAAGSTTNVSQGASVDLTGTYTRPPTGTYTHGYAMMDNTFGITASIQIDGCNGLVKQVEEEFIVELLRDQEIIPQLVGLIRMSQYVLPQK